MIPDVVIVGAGLWGSSIAWHLARCHGARVRVVERRDASGLETSARAAGQIGQLRRHPLAIQAAAHALEFASSLAHRRDQQAFVRSGSVALIEHRAAAAALQPRVTSASAAGMAIQRLSSDDARRLVPGLQGEFAAAYYIPADGYVTPRRFLRALTAEVTSLGVVFDHSTDVQALDFGESRVVALRTSRGSIAGGTFVVAAGPWTAAVLQRRLPVVPIAHGLARTIAADVPSDRPVVRFPDHGLYTRPEQHAHLFGRFGPHPTAANTTSGRGQPMALEPDYRELATTRDLVARWMPRIAALPVEHFRQGWTTFSPDGLPLAGPHPELRNVWVATGCCASGFVWGPSLGAWLAESLEAGRVAPALAALDPGRFGSRVSDAAWLHRACLRQFTDHCGLRGVADAPVPALPNEEYSSWT